MARADRDHYEIYYADKLWNLLPAVYRAQDSEDFDHKGPLRELIDRMGAQAAILRRGIDRLWEDQSIETCDDWVISYLGDLLATNLVASLDARGQRLDVAKTIYYRRRKGTVAILEEIAHDVTGWDARIVEFFRRLGRTRHGLDPEIGVPARTDDPVGHRALQLAEGLVGHQTNTPAGGWADLRKVYGALKAHTAFDEFASSADLRRGQGQVGWHNISHLGVFLWRLRSFGVDQTTPVAILGCPAGQYVFDPTGRAAPAAPPGQEVGLFARGKHPYGDAWVSPVEWQLPTPISRPLLQFLNGTGRLSELYDDSDQASLGVFRKPGSDYVLVDPHQLALYPELGRFTVLNPPNQDTVYVTYHYGFSSTIGAGPYDRRVLGQKPAPLPAPTNDASGGGSVLAIPLAAVAPQGTITIGDSLTYTTVGPVGAATPIQQVTIQAKNKRRPLIRLPVPAPDPFAWEFTGANDQSALTFAGLFISGGDLVLRGTFGSVTLTCCTLDPGESGHSTSPPTLFTPAVDRRDLIPCHIWVEGTVTQLTIDRSIVGPIRTRGNGRVVELVSLTDSIAQAIRTSDVGLLTLADLRSPMRLVVKLRDTPDQVSVFLKGHLTTGTQQALQGYAPPGPPSGALLQALVADLNVLLGGPSLYDPPCFAGVTLSSAVRSLIAENPLGAELVQLNRLLLEAAYPLELTDSCLDLSVGTVKLTRSTLLGPAYVHRLEASECILDDIVQVEDAQDGCVRFSAWATGSILPRQYESVEVAPGSPLFTARDFGRPGYAQLLASVDGAIVSGAPGATISAGAENGSEMGAFAREKNPIKERSLLIKFDEFMPLGLAPVIVYVT